MHVINRIQRILRLDKRHKPKPPMLLRVGVAFVRIRRELHVQHFPERRKSGKEGRGGRVEGETADEDG